MGDQLYPPAPSAGWWIWWEEANGGCFLTLNEHLHGQSLVPRRLWLAPAQPAGQAGGDGVGENNLSLDVFMFSSPVGLTAQSVGYEVLFLSAPA